MGAKQHAWDYDGSVLPDDNTPSAGMSLLFSDGSNYTLCTYYIYFLNYVGSGELKWERDRPWSASLTQKQKDERSRRRPKAYKRKKEITAHVASENTLQPNINLTGRFPIYICTSFS